MERVEGLNVKSRLIDRISPAELGFQLRQAD
jgi:hypothetical protein